jgi:DNA-binding transcriptional MocR family regulator
MPANRYTAVAEDFAKRIHSGELTPGTQLPTVRSLMRTYQMALATASRVYSELELRGLVVGETGRGTFVRDPSMPRTPGMQVQGSTATVVDLTYSYPSLPILAPMLREGLSNLATSGDIDALLHYSPPGGRPHQRATVARHLRNRGIRVPGEQVLIVNGAQQGLSASVLALFKPGDTLAVDALTFSSMIALAQDHRLELVPVPLADGSMDIDFLDRLCKKRKVRATYVMPTLHNPLGSVMSLRVRKHLVEVARKNDFFIIEDGTYAFLVEPAPTPVFTLAPERTVYVNGLSKSVAAGLRIGFVAAPLHMVPELERAVRLAAWSVPTVTVALACRWIESGVIDKLEEDKRRDAGQRQQLVRRVLRGLDIRAHPSSYLVWISLSQGMRADDIAAYLKEESVLVVTAESFSATKHVPQALRLMICSVPMDMLKVALEKVRIAVMS